MINGLQTDPMCAMQAWMDGFEVVSAYHDGLKTGEIKDINTKLLGDTDVLVTTTGNIDVCDSAMLQCIKKGAIVCNIGHFDNEIDTAYMRKNWGWEEVNLKCIRSSAQMRKMTIYCYSQKAPELR